MRIKLNILLLILNSLSITAQPSVSAMKKMPGENAATLKQSGTPGPSARIFMRCGYTISQGNEPLYVVDGFLYEPAQIKSLNANEIENIHILKESAAVVIYGYRAFHGVIIITTKKSQIKKFIIKDTKDRKGIGYATITAISLKTGDSVSFVANEFGIVETTLLKSLDYKVRISSIGYVTKEYFLKEITKNAFEIYIEKSIINLNEVTIESMVYGRRISCGGLFMKVNEVSNQSFKSKNKAEVKIYPNPVSTSGTINISFPNVKAGSYQIRLLSTNGQLFYSFKKQISNKNETEQFHLGNQIVAGHYLLQVMDEQKNTVQTSKVIVQ